MSVTRVNEFFAKPHELENLRQILSSIRSEICAAKGCREFRILECDTEPNRFVILETWDSIESHEAAVQKISMETIERAKAMLASTPDGNYYSEVTG